MPVLNRIAALAPEMTAWRRHLHAHPELGFDCHRTAAFVAGLLRGFGVDALHEGIAQSGVVAVIEGRRPGPGVVGLRADMDALPLTEATGADWASAAPGRMHACGHDGHTAMLLGAAQYLCETRNFAGRVVLIFQPAEENGGGAEVMLREGLMARFGLTEVYALHIAPGLGAGVLATEPGPIMAAVDSFAITVQGRGGHAALPHLNCDPIPPALAIAQAVPTLVSHSREAADRLVVAVTQLHAGTADNITPDTAWINGTVRSFDAAVQARVEARLGEIVQGIAAAFGVTAVLDYQRGYPATINDPDRARFAAAVAAEVAGEDNVIPSCGAEMGAEDFSYLLEACPGAYLYLGQGPGPGLHHPGFDFDDAVAPVGASFLARVAERAMPV